MRSSSVALAGVWALLFIGVALIADHVATQAIMQSPSLDVGRIERILGESHPDEIPILGASKVAHDYDPSVLGLRSYNYGMPDASLDVTNFLLAHEVRSPSTQPVIIDLVQYQLDLIGDPSNYVPFAALPGTRELMQRAGQWQWYYDVPGLRYFGSWDTYARGLLTDHLTRFRKVTRGYTAEVNGAGWNAAEFAADIRRRLQSPLHWGIDPRQEQDLLALMAGAPTRTFVIVLSPLHSSFLAHASGEADFRQQLAKLQALKNVRVLDFTRMNLPDNDFEDSGHLDEPGARAFSGALRAQLIEMGFDPGPAEAP